MPTFVRPDLAAGVLFKGDIGIAGSEHRSILRDLDRAAIEHSAGSHDGRES